MNTDNRKKTYWAPIFKLRDNLQRSEDQRPKIRLAFAKNTIHNLPKVTRAKFLN